ncbi:TROVE domain-containing protein [Rugosimonospora africana]|uniref:RNA-binding protein n=1 Tax=Rugosimonospora africana TaxID=556532 RepID=A0A8J3QXN3_9ACTN|nr:TROVE domain-containing protein [Rugosimonospora africana]GIH19305.1 RNA-binding protein [Rugosimonospora africana]
MSKFNIAKLRPARGRGPVTTTKRGVTHEGAPGYVRDVKGELFILAVCNLTGEDTFYESAGQRDDRFAQLVGAVAVDDVAWLLRFIKWLRTGANLRSAPLVAAAEAVHARLAAGRVGDNRALIDAALNRADEPGELLAYWQSRFGRALPKPVKRGLGDAALRLYAEYPLLKYDTGAKGVRFADVLCLAHPAGRRGGQSKDDLFRYAIDRRRGRDAAPAETLAMVRANAALRGLADGDPQALLDADRLRAAGMTWEDVLSLVGSKLPKAKLWEALIPSMGIMALARNLRNFDEAGVSDRVAAAVIARFTDPAQVAKSRMFPFRWLSAYEAAPSLRWGHALDRALQASLSNLPALPGRTLVLVDTSGSMTGLGLSARSKVTPLKTAAVFGVALAAKGEAVDLVGFANGVFTHPVGKGASVIREVDRFVKRSGEVGHGTNIAGSLRASYAGHDRVVIVSDMQTMGRDVSTAIPESTMMYGFNLGGYRVTALNTSRSNRVELGGLTDATFRMLPLIEAGRNADWPF